MTEPETDAQIVEAVAVGLMGWQKILDKGKYEWWAIGPVWQALVSGWNPFTREDHCAAVLDRLAELYDQRLYISPMRGIEPCGWICYIVELRCDGFSFRESCCQGMNAASRRRAIVLCAREVVRGRDGVKP